MDLEQFLFKNKDFILKRGNHLAIVGSTGTGKTTLLKLILKTIAKDNSNSNYSNALKVKYVDVKHHFKNINSNTSFFYQQRYSNPFAADSELVQNNIENSIATKGKSGFWALDKVSYLFSLTTLMDKRLIQLSNGETKRLRIATAL